MNSTFVQMLKQHGPGTRIGDALRRQLAHTALAQPAVKRRKAPGEGRRGQEKAWACEMMRLPGLFVPIRVSNPLNRSREGAWWEKHKDRKHRPLIAALMARHRDAWPCDLTITRYGPREMDFEGLVASLKHVVDGVADAFGVNDREMQKRLTYRQERAKFYGVRIIIMPT